MKTMTWTLLMAVAATTLSFVATSPAVAAGEETVATETEYCGICEAKKMVAGGLPDWFTFGLDQRIRETYRNNVKTLNSSEEDLFGRFRTRLWGRVTPMENVEIGARLVWEWFIFCKPDAADSTPSSNALFDELYVKASNVFGLPMTVTAGRQAMRLGDGWLVFEGTPLDGSRTIYFDAVRMTYALADQGMTVDAIFVANRADPEDTIKPFNDDAVEGNISEADETGGILWVNKALNDDMGVDGYAIYVHRDDPDSANNLADLFTVGARLAGNWGEQIAYRAEGAYQFGQKESAGGCNMKVCDAFGINSRITYMLLDEMSTALYAGYEYRSGDDNPAKSFDILWGRYPQFSDIQNGLLDTLEGPAGATPNMHRLYVGASAKPIEDVVVLLNYHLMFADENNQPTTNGFSAHGDVRGHLFTSQVKVVHNEHAASTVTAEAFLPGNYYNSDRNEVATFARYELMLIW